MIESDTKEVTLVVTVQVCMLDGEREPTKEEAEQAAQQAVSETLNNANNRGYTHINSDTLGVNVVDTEAETISPIPYNSE